MIRAEQCRRPDDDYGALHHQWNLCGGHAGGLDRRRSLFGCYDWGVSVIMIYLPDCRSVSTNTHRWLVQVINLFDLLHIVYQGLSTNKMHTRTLWYFFQSTKWRACLGGKS